jgi:hypothetical protein
MNRRRLSSVQLNGLEDSEYFQDGEVFEFVFVTRRLEPSWDRSSLIIMLEWKGGMAERRGVGWIDLTSDVIDNSFPPGPIWKETILG